VYAFQGLIHLVFATNFTRQYSSAVPEPANPTTKIYPALDRSPLYPAAGSATSALHRANHRQSSHGGARSLRNIPSNWGKTGSVGLEMG